MRTVMHRVLHLIALLSLLAACTPPAMEVEPGVSLALAEDRTERISNINYALHFAIPVNAEEDIDGFVRLSFELARNDQPLLLDFREDADHLHSVSANGEAIAVNFRNEHIVLPTDSLATGENVVEIEFTAGSTSLNRNPEYLYTLFVPDRARTAFPLFDQPDLKATYDLALEIPGEWSAMSNAPESGVDDQGDRKEIRFERTELIPSYLFSFVAGEFETVERDVGGRQLTMLHREPDTTKVARNVDAIFELHAAALDWLEEYTGIDYPFAKLGFALIPGFQYGGMEHVGAIQYRASSLMLEEAPSDTQLLSRASLISHEVSHMWFGNLVTMEWFNDVWTKEVFANFMAAKIVNPSFPNINHELNFMVRHFPRAYSVDRTEGANPIRQHLPNLNEAGQMYGAIIYNKAPIMMRELELELGETAFREGIQEYLETFSYANATWPALIEILDRRTDIDLATWSDDWVHKPGRPEFEQKSNDVMAYGLFPGGIEDLDDWALQNEVARASTLINTYENLLENRGVRPSEYLERLLSFVPSEENTLVLDLLLRQIRSTYWLFLDENVRLDQAAAVEAVLWETMLSRTKASERKSLFMAFANIALTDDGVARTYQVWNEELTVDDLPLGENDQIAIAKTLAIKLPSQADTVMGAQRERTENADNVRKLEFIGPSLSPDQAVRDQFFASLSNPANRETESWVLEALEALHHPLRVEESEKYILPSLELLQEIQVTGDIFFPKRWLDETLTSYRSDSAVDSVRSFLEERPEYNAQLRLKMLQSADLVFRANALGSNNDGTADN